MIRLLPLMTMWILTGLAGVVAAAQAASSEPAPQVLVTRDVREQPDAAALRAIFSMKVSRWSDGRPIRVFVLPDRHPLHRRFAKEVLGIFPYQLRQIWDRGIYSGTGRAPEQVSSVDEMREMLGRTTGAIGYLPAGTEAEGVRRVR